MISDKLAGRNEHNESLIKTVRESFDMLEKYLDIYSRNYAKNDRITIEQLIDHMRTVRNIYFK